jgi:outer membrane lipoprotein carrier protein
MNKASITICLGILVFLVMPADLYALDANRHLQMQLEKLDSFTASFNQRVIDIDRTTVDPSSGTISFKRPGKFIWSYEEPYEQEIISDGESLWVFDKDLEQVTVRPAAGQATQTPLQILDDPDSVEEHYHIELLTEREDIVEIQLTPLAEDIGFKYVILIFDDNGLAGMEIYDSFDHYNSLTFDNIKLNASLDNDLFSFITPEGVDVIHAAE